MRHRQWAVAGLMLTGLAATACAAHSATPGGPASPNKPAKGVRAAATLSAALRTERTSVGTVLANAQGRTLYWFAIDTPTRSQCAGSCLTAWPAVRGKPRAAKGATAPGSLGEIKRPDGIEQATWDGHPLYTYFGDTAPGQAYGNMINAYGGVWHAAVIPAGPASPGPASGRSATPTPSPSRT